MSKPTIYFAHPVWTYGTAVESAIVAALSKDYVVVNPNAPEHQAAYVEEGMGYFSNMVTECDALVYLCESGWDYCNELSDVDQVGAGVAKEILEAFVHGLDVHIAYQYESDPTRWMLFDRTEMPAIILTIDETRARRAAKMAERAAA